MSGARGRWHHTTSFCLSLGVMDRHGQGEGREACSPRAQLCNVQTMLCLSDVSLRIFKNMHKDQLEETVTLE